MGEPVAELARLPWVPLRAALNPERVSRRARATSMDVLPLIRCPNRKSTKRTRVKLYSQPCKGFNRICAASAHTARAIQSLQDWEAIITQVPKALLRLDRRPWR